MAAAAAAEAAAAEAASAEAAAAEAAAAEAAAAPKATEPPQAPTARRTRPRADLSKRARAGAKTRAFALRCDGLGAFRASSRASPFSEAGRRHRHPRARRAARVPRRRGCGDEGLQIPGVWGV